MWIAGAIIGIRRRPEGGGKVDKNNLTQFVRAMAQLGLELSTSKNLQPLLARV